MVWRYDVLSVRGGTLNVVRLRDINRDAYKLRVRLSAAPGQASGPHGPGLGVCGGWVGPYLAGLPPLSILRNPETPLN